MNRSFQFVSLQRRRIQIFPQEMKYRCCSNFVPQIPRGDFRERILTRIEKIGGGAEDQIDGRLRFAEIRIQMRFEWQFCSPVQTPSRMPIEIQDTTTRLYERERPDVPSAG